MVDPGRIGNPTASMSGDSNYRDFHDSNGESPWLLAHTLFTRQNFSACFSACFSSADLGGCSATDSTCLSKSQVFINSVATCIEQICPVADNIVARNPQLSAGLPQASRGLVDSPPDGGNGVATADILSASRTSLIDSTTLANAISPAAASVTTSSSITGSSSSTSASSSGGSGTFKTSAISIPSSSDSANGKSNIMTTAIVTGVAGFLALVLFGVGLLWFCKSCRKRRAQAIAKEKFPSEHLLTRWERHSSREDVDRYSVTQYSLLGSPRRPEPLEMPPEDFSDE